MKPIRVLIAEDNPHDAELLVHELRRAGFDPQWHRADTEADYLSHLDAGLDIILSDFEIPRFGGMRALALLRESGLEVPFILVSGTIGEAAAVEIMKLGAADYLLKDRLTRLGPAVQQAIEQHRRHQERHRAEEALRASEERFRQLAETIQDVFWITDPDRSHVLYVSPAYETIWGRPCADLYAAPRIWMEAIHPEDRVRVREAVATRQAAGTYDEEYRILRPDGEDRSIHDTAFPVKDAAGNVLRIVGVARDITARQQLEEQFRQAQKMEAVGQLASGIAHDFNNILSVVEGYASLLQARAISGSEAAREISAAVARASALSRQLLTFSSRQPLQLREVDLSAVVADVTTMLRRLLSDEITLTIETAADLPAVSVDPRMIEQILMNLTINSRHAMPEGGRLTIATEAATVSDDEAARTPELRPGRAVCLRVSDTGAGIPPAVLPRIFEPFFTTKEAGKGTGLGLSTVQGIMREHRGSIRIESEVGRGTTFFLTFPASQSTAAPAPKEPEVAPLAGGHETVLVVDDEPTVRKIVVFALRHYGYRVLEAASGPQALALFATHQAEIDLLLTDLVMPDGVSGQALAAEIRVGKPAVRVLFTSGYSAERLQDGSSDGETLHFLHKPYSTEKLLNAVRACLAG